MNTTSSSSFSWIDIIKLVIPSALTYILTLLTLYVRHRKKPLYDSPYGQPQIGYYHIQSLSDLGRIQDMDVAKKCYQCKLDTKVVKDGEVFQRTDTFILNEINIQQLSYTEKLAYFLISNNSNIDIAIDCVSVRQKEKIFLNNYPQVHIKSKETLSLLFNLAVKPQSIFIDFDNGYLEYIVGNKPQILKIAKYNKK